MGNNILKYRSKINLLSLIMLAGLLASCVSLGPSRAPAGNQNQAGAAAAPVPATGSTTDAALESAAEATAQGAEAVDNGINRVGQIIQLGAFVENIPQVEPPENDVIELNYEQEDLRLVLEELGNALQINMVIDPTIDDRVSLRTSPDNPLQYADIWPLMRLLAANAGITIEQAGNVYQFLKNDSNIPVEIVTPAFLNNATSSIVLQLTPLIYVSMDAAEEILNPLLQPAGSIIRLGQSNILGISGTPGQLSRVNALLDIIDTDPFRNQGIQLYELLNSQATEVAEELQNILQLIEGANSSYQVLGLERINSVLVISPASRGFDEVTRWVRVLDAESQEQVEQLFFYKVKNLNAVTLAQTLTSVFEQDENEVNRTAEEGSAETVADGPGDSPPPTVSDGTVSANLRVIIVADEDTNSLLVRSTPRDYRQLLTTINNLDTVPLQVLINAVIGQVTLTDSNQFGVDWTRVSGNVNSGPARLSSRNLPAGLLNQAGLATQGSGLVLTQVFAEGSAIIDVTLNAIAQDNEVTLLARPSIMVINNQEGEIKVGQSVPIDTGTTVTATATVGNIVYRDVGIVLTITPHINEDGFINLEIFQSLSSVEDSSGGVSNNPIFTNQEITTTAVVADQATIILGGLIQEEELTQNTGVPVLRKIPLLGALFSYRESRSVRRELFVILRPQIIRGDETDVALMQQFRNTLSNVSALLQQAGL